MTNTFIEIGVALQGSLTHLLYKDWKHRVDVLEKIQEGQSFTPKRFLSTQCEWEGWFVEPVPRFLISSMEDARGAERAHFIQGAVDAESKFQEIDIYKLTNEPSEMCEMSSLVFHQREDHRQNHRFLDKMLLQTFTLDTLLDYLDITPTILRMDVEGVERRVLESYSWKRFPQFWQIDHHGENQDYFVNTFEENGYRILGTSCGLNDDEIHVEKVRATQRAR